MLDDLSVLARHAEECDKRLDEHGRRLQVLELNALHDTGEIASLRATRHEHGTYIQRHVLELQEIKQRQTETYEKRLCEAEKGVTEMFTKHEDHQKLLSGLASDVRLASWKIGAVIGVIVAVLNIVFGQLLH